MMISTKGRYALRIMVDLAQHDGEEPVSVRGAQGGYHLAYAPGEITVGMILRATEGDLAPAECVLDGAHHCDRRGACPSRTVFSKVYSAINEVIDGVTLLELMPEGNPAECGTA